MSIAIYCFVVCSYKTTFITNKQRVQVYHMFINYSTIIYPSQPDMLSRYMAHTQSSPQQIIYIYIIYNILMRGQRRKTLTQTVQYFNHPTMVRRFIYIMTIIQHTILHTYQWPVYSCTSQQPSSVTSSDTNVIESI